MRRNENLDILTKKLLDNENILNKFCSLDSLNEIYEFCLSIQGGYDKEEFALFIDELLSSVDTLELNKITESNLNLVAAGKNNMDFKKILATSLASLSFITTPVVNATSNNTIDTSVNTKTSKSTNEKVSTWDQVKQKASRIRDWFVNNKGKVTIGLILGGVLLYNKENISKIINPKQEENKKPSSKSDLDEYPGKPIPSPGHEIMIPKYGIPTFRNSEEENKKPSSKSDLDEYPGKPKPSPERIPPLKKYGFPLFGNSEETETDTTDTTDWWSD